MSYKIVKHYLTKNRCYKSGIKRTKTTGIIKHSTGANNPNLCRYIDDEKNLGKNTGNNHWNMGNISKCVHFMIGKDKNGNIAIYQLLPMDYRCWGCGSGSKGSYNSTHVQYEICEDGLTDKKYFEEAFAAAAWLDAYICKKYSLKTSSIVSHKEAHDKGYATNHGDCDHWLKKHGKTMAWARSEAQKELGNVTEKKVTTKIEIESAKSKSSTFVGTYVVNTKTDPLILRSGAGTDKKEIAKLKKGSLVKCYGYFTGDWLLVVSGDSTGFVYKKYLKKQ